MWLGECRGPAPYTRDAGVINLDERSLKEGLLGLVIALVEIIGEALKHQALGRVEVGSLTPEETERLGRALMALDEAIAQIKEEAGIAQAVQSVRDGLDHLVEDMLAPLEAERWEGQGA